MEATIVVALKGYLYLLCAVVVVVVFFYLLIGAITTIVIFRQWYKYEQFHRGIISTPLAFLTGVCFWPVVLKKIK